MKHKYFFKDFTTGKIRYTKGTFSGWTPKQGLVNARYAIFVNPKGTVYVPEYCLTKETKKELPSDEAKA